MIQAALVAAEILPEITRTCGQCGTPDRLIGVVGGGVEHFVKPEILYADRGEDASRLPRLLRNGWKKITFQGRVAVQRFCCVNCLNENYQRDKVWAEMHKDARRLEQQQKGSANNYWLNLCED